MTRLFGAALLAAVMVQPATDPGPVEGEGLTVRVTYYGWESCAAWPCVMATGYAPHEGAAAASSWLFPFGTVLQLPTGRTVTVLDRGGGINGQAWLDVFCVDVACQQEIVNLGPYTTVTVHRWGFDY